jgi:hypothetical protein
MLGPGRYLLGVAEVLWLVGFAWLGASRVRAWLVPRFEGAPAALASALLALTLLIWCAELLGSFRAFAAVPYLLLVGAAGVLAWKLAPRPEPEEGTPDPYLLGGMGSTFLRRDGRRWKDHVPALIAFLLAAVAFIHFAGGAKTRLSTGMTGFDSTWYHGPFAAGFFQGGDTWSLHFIAPQFLAWFYPANGEILHAAGMLAFDRDVLSPLLNLGWFAGCLLACWCIGRPFGVAPWSLALGAITLSVPALADQAGEARNDVVGIFFLLAAVAVALNAWRDGLGTGGAGVGPYLVVGLGAGLAAGTKLNFLLPAAVLILGMAGIAPRGSRWRVLGASAVAALAGGGYWYLRNLAQAGNPLPWLHHLGPIDLPAPQQALGGREAHSVLGYLTDLSVWSDWFLPGLHGGLWIIWPALLLGALTGFVLAVAAGVSSRGSNPTNSVQEEPHDGDDATAALAVVGLVGLACAAAWLVAPTSASGPDGTPRGFESALRYLAPALVLGLVLLPTVPPLRRRLHHLTGVWSTFGLHRWQKLNHTPGRGRGWVAAGLGALLLVVAAGYPVQRHYLRERYADPTFTAPGLNAAFAWARGLSGARIATTGTRQYPLFGTDLSNHVRYLGIERSHGGFEAPQTCPQYRRLLNEGHYDYAIATRDRIEPGKPPYPDTARWTQDPSSHVILRKPPTVVFALRGPLDPSACS